MRGVLAMLAVALIGCTAEGEIVETDDGDDTQSPSADDLDDDGWGADEDCDDRDPYAFPGNAETWDGRDNDCDGNVDGEGAFEGGHQVGATAIYEGSPVSFSLTCPTEFTRYPGTLAFTITCTPDPEDEDAMMLLGAEITVAPIDNGVTGGAWQGAVEVTSANGWSTEGEGTASWVGMDQVVLTTELDTVSLEWEGDGLLGRADE